MKMVGRVEVPQEAFIAALSTQRVHRLQEVTRAASRAVCVSGADLLAAARPAARPQRHRQAAGRPAGSPSGELGLDGDVQVNRRYHGGEGQAVYAYAQEDADWWVAELGRELPPGRFGENLRTTGPRPHRRRARRALADRDGAVRGHRPAHPVRQLRPLLGRAAPGQAVHRPRRHRRLPAGARDRRRRRRRRRRGGLPARPRGHRRRGASGRSPPSSTGCPSSRRRCDFLPVKDQPKTRAATHRAADRPRGLSSVARATVRRGRPGPDPADGEVAVLLRRGGAALLALAAARALPACAGVQRRRAPRRVGARSCSPAPRQTLDEAPDRPLRPDQHGRADDRHACSSAVRATSPGRRPSRARSRCTRSAPRVDLKVDLGRRHGLRPAAVHLRATASVDPAAVRVRRPGRAARPEHRHLPAARRGASRRSSGDEKRVSGEVVREVTGDAARRPGRSRCSPARTRASRCTARSRSPPTAAQLRRAVLTGPFFAAGEDAHLHPRAERSSGPMSTITAPPTG